MVSGLLLAILTLGVAIPSVIAGYFTDSGSGQGSSLYGNYAEEAEEYGCTEMQRVVIPLYGKGYCVARYPEASQAPGDGPGGSGDGAGAGAGSGSGGGSGSCK